MYFLFSHLILLARCRYVPFILIFYLAAGQVSAQSSKRTLLFAGSFTNGQVDTGIYVYEFFSHTGKLQRLFALPEIVNPSYISLSQDGRTLYSCTESKLKDRGSYSSFKIDSISGHLTQLSNFSSYGENPVYVEESADSKFLVGVTYSSATISTFKLNGGSIAALSQSFQVTGKSVHPERQEKAHLHGSVFSPDKKYLYVTDLGSDKILVYRYQPLSRFAFVPYPDLDVHCVEGSGPRHLRFHPNGKFAYCIEELSGTATVYSYENGQLIFLQRLSSYEKKFKDHAASDLHIAKDGSFLYASNRLENSIAIFSINQTSGKLSFQAWQNSGGINPRAFALSPTSEFLFVANQEDNKIAVFKRDAASGLLTLLNSYSVRNVSSIVVRNYER